MLARVNIIEVRPGMVAQASEFWETQMLPLLKQQPGFKGTHLWGDHSSNRISVASLWETEAAYAAWAARSTAQEQHAQIAPILISQTREDYEVLVQYVP